MNKLVDLVKLDRLDRLIRLHATGTPDALRATLDMSRSSLFELLSFLRFDMQAPLRYNKYIPSYVYDYPPRFYLGFEKDRLNPDEQMDVIGGLKNEDMASDDDDRLNPDEQQDVTGGTISEEQDSDQDDTDHIVD